MALGQARGLVRPQRMNRIELVDENVETAGRAGVGQFRTKSGSSSAGCRRSTRSYRPSVHEVRLLPALPARREHPAQHRALQQHDIVQGQSFDALPEPVPRPAGERAGPGVPGLRDVRGAARRASKSAS